MNLLLWFDYDIDGEINRLCRIEALPPDFDLDKHFVKFMMPPYAGGGIDRIEREHVVVPDRLIGIEATSYVLYYQGKRFRAAMPYFQTISPSS